MSLVAKWTRNQLLRMSLVAKATTNPQTRVLSSTACVLGRLGPTGTVALRMLPSSHPFCPSFTLLRVSTCYEGVLKGAIFHGTLKVMMHLTCRREEALNVEGRASLLLPWCRGNGRLAFRSTVDHEIGLREKHRSSSSQPQSNTELAVVTQRPCLADCAATRLDLKVHGRRERRSTAEGTRRNNAAPETWHDDQTGAG
jgi:hypothetical protein